ncbi:MAG: ABC transporter substrate-binding protein [Candidatus Dojkabacteria bacterium]|nr:MAG: ABC transporter substrate-binding protein [Candidatus Dojkabacteria bacterium]
MASIRDELWQYPDSLLPYLRKYRVLAIVVAGLCFGFIGSFFMENVLAVQKSRVFSTNVYSEGFVGENLRLHPLVQAPTSYEKDVSRLIYSSLVKIDAIGNMLPDLSQTWTISEDGKSYTFFLRQGVYWHDGVEFTSEDVKTTFELMKAGGASVPNGEILKDVEIRTPGKYTIEFVLPQSNSSFLELVVVGIVPSHIYKGYTYNRYASSVVDARPIGTGPYRFQQKVNNVYTLRVNDRYYAQKPVIPTVQLKAYITQSEALAAFAKGDVYSIVNVSPDKAPDFSRYKTTQLQKYSLSNNTRVVFFNITIDKEKLSPEVRTAFAYSVDKRDLIEQIPGSEMAYGPYSPSSWVYNPAVEDMLVHSPARADEILEKAGWIYNEEQGKRMKGDESLVLTLTFLDTDQNRLIVEKLREYAKSIGIDLVLDPTDRETITQKVLPERAFEMLLFEVQTSTDPDLYTLWHSSQAKYPGLNISGIDSSRVDGLLERGRITTNRDNRYSYYRQFQEVLVDEVPAIFLYHPPLYTVRFDIIQKPEEDTYLQPEERLSTLTSWRIEPRWRNWQTR